MTRLHAAERNSEIPGATRHQVDKSVDQKAVEHGIEDPSAPAAGVGEKMDDAVEHLLVELRESPRQEMCRLNEDGVVEFVEPPFVD